MGSGPLVYDFIASDFCVYGVYVQMVMHSQVTSRVNGSQGWCSGNGKMFWSGWFGERNI